jgi:hypothetical protein
VTRAVCSLSFGGNTQPLYIGFNPGQGTFGHWKGLIDELKVRTDGSGGPGEL